MCLLQNTSRKRPVVYLKKVPQSQSSPSVSLGMRIETQKLGGRGTAIEKEERGERERIISSVEVSGDLTYSDIETSVRCNTLAPCSLRFRVAATVSRGETSVVPPNERTRAALLPLCVAGVLASNFQIVAFECLHFSRAHYLVRRVAARPLPCPTRA